jgi:SAM-dependent methyltransferase
MEEPMTDEATRARNGRGYAVNAPYYDLIFPEAARSLLADELRKLLAGTRRVVDLGAGTGALTEAILEVLAPDGEVWAVEPTAVMRAALATRLSSLARATEAATIVPADALEAEVPDGLDAVVACNVVMHLSPTERRATWARWVGALEPGGIVVVEQQYPQESQEVPASLVPGRRLGRRSYETLCRADVLDDERITWTMTYRVREGDRLVAEDTADFACWIVSDAQLDAELAEVGCQPVEDVSPGVRAWRRTG